MNKKLNYYYVCDCRCCKARIYVTCSDIAYNHYKERIGGPTDLMVDKLFLSMPYPNQMDNARIVSRERIVLMYATI